LTMAAAKEAMCAACRRWGTRLKAGIRCIAEVPKREADIVNMGYVLNVIEDQQSGWLRWWMRIGMHAACWWCPASSRRQWSPNGHAIS